MSTSLLLEGRDISKTFKRGRNDTVDALDNVDIKLEKGRLTSVMGPSGSGKTTLLNCLSGLDEPDQGKVLFRDENIVGWSETKLTRFRQLYVGFVFQNYELIDTLTALENIAMPLLPRKSLSTKEIKKIAKSAFKQVGLSKELRNQRPPHLSGGEQQRVGIARAIVGRKKLIFADEPTGSLDEDSAKNVMNLLKRIARQGAAVIIVTHNEDLANRYGDRIYRIQYGKLSKKK